MYTFKNSNSFYYIKYKQYNIFCTQFALNWSFTLHIKHVPYFLNLLTINYIKLFFWRFLFFWMWTIFKVFIDSVVFVLVCLLEKAMAPHSSTLAWKIPWTEEPVRLQSMGSLRVRQDWATSLSLFTFMHWRRKWQPTPVFLPGESQGRGSLVGCRLWGLTELDTTEVT